MSALTQFDTGDDSFSITNLRIAVTNEVSSPELLPYNQELLDYFFTSIKEKQDIGDEVQTEQEKRIADIFRLDIERVKYYLQVYLRVRLLKIDKYHISLLASEEATAKMSEAEQKYAVNYKKILQRHFVDSFLKDIPERLRGLEDVKSDVNMVPEPNLETPVFCRVLQDIGEVTFEPGTEPVNMHTGAVFVLKYRYIRPFLLDSLLELL